MNLIYHYEFTLRIELTGSAFMSLKNKDNLGNSVINQFKLYKATIRNLL